MNRAFVRVSLCYLNICHLYAGLQPQITCIFSHNLFVDNNNNNTQQQQHQRDNGVDVRYKYTMAPLSEVSSIIMITTQSAITAVNAGAILRGNLKQ